MQALRIWVAQCMYGLRNVIIREVNRHSWQMSKIKFGWILLHTGIKIKLKIFQNSKFWVGTKVKKCSLPKKSDFGPKKIFLTSKGPPFYFSQKWRFCKSQLVLFTSLIITFLRLIYEVNLRTTFEELDKYAFFFADFSKISFCTVFKNLS